VRVKSWSFKNASSAAAPDPSHSGAAQAAEQFAAPKPTVAVPSTPLAIVGNLLAKEIADPSGPVEDISPTVKTLMRLNAVISGGGDIGEIKTDIIRIAAHQPEKADVFQSILNLIDQERATDWVFIRAYAEKRIKRAAQRGEISTSECVALWQIANTLVEKYQDKSAKLNKPVDTVTVVEKVDTHQIHAEQIIEQRWEGTTPQGRQIIRMKLFDLKRQIIAKAQVEAAKVHEPVIAT
jgi:hypothetical protein